ncbi:MAG: hypothetical protein ABSF53_05290 [Terracidiphilus sp.]
MNTNGTITTPKQKRGKKMNRGKGWRLTGPNGRIFKAALIRRMKINGATVVILKVRERPKKE